MLYIDKLFYSENISYPELVLSRSSNFRVNSISKFNYKYSVICKIKPIMDNLKNKLSFGFIFHNYNEMSNMPTKHFDTLNLV